MFEVVGSFDAVDMLLILFGVFFVGLVFYLQQEGYREGYPLERDRDGAPAGVLTVMPAPKTYLREDGSTVVSPNLTREPVDVPNARPIAPTPGAPIEPTGNPLLAGVGPGAYANRANVPEMTYHNEPKIQPLRAATAFSILEGDTDPRGLNVVCPFHKVAGQVSDVWVDVGEQIIRYYEVELADGSGKRLIPNTFCLLRDAKGRTKEFYVHAVFAEQMTDCPQTSKDTSITMLEEEKISAFYGAGLMYADRHRSVSYL